MTRRLFAQALLLLTSLAGCASIIGAEFDELRRGSACEGCAQTGGEAGLDGSGGRGGSAGVRPVAPSGGEGSAAVAGDGGLVPRAGAGGMEGGAGGEGGHGAPPCVTTAECIERHDGAPTVCRRSACVPVTTDACPLLLPSSRPLVPADALEYLHAASPLLIGAFVDERQLHDSSVSVVNWDLAFYEMNALTEGGFDGGRRPVLLLVCSGAEDRLVEGLEHLTLELGVTGVLSALPSDRMVRAYQHTRSPVYRKAGGHGVFFLSTEWASPPVAFLQDEGFVWHVQGGPGDLAASTAALVRRVESYVQGRRVENFERTGGDDPETPLRLALVTPDDPRLADVASLLTSDDANRATTLIFNGQPAVDQSDSFHTVLVRSGSPPLSADYELVVNRLRAHQPHVVVSLAGAETLDAMTSIESSWSELSRLRPYWIFPDDTPVSAAFLAAVEEADTKGDPPLHERLVGVGYSEIRSRRLRQLIDTYDARLFAFAPAPFPDGLRSSGQYYDAAYLLIYAHVAAGAIEQEVTGEEIRDAFVERVISDDPNAEIIDLHPLWVGLGVELLSEPAPLIRFLGTMGEPDYDRATGVRKLPTSAWCVDVDDGSATGSVDGLLYDHDLEIFFDPAGGPPACMDQY